MQLNIHFRLAAACSTGRYCFKIKICENCEVVRRKNFFEINLNNMNIKHNPNKIAKCKTYLRISTDLTTYVHENLEAISTMCNSHAALLVFEDTKLP